MRDRRYRADEIPQAQAAVVGANIRILRQRNGWAQARLGELMGWQTNSTVCAAEGHRNGAGSADSPSASVTRRPGSPALPAVPGANQPSTSHVALVVAAILNHPGTPCRHGSAHGELHLAPDTGADTPVSRARESPNLDILRDREVQIARHLDTREA